MNLPCDISVPCPSTDNPFANLSSELTDGPSFTAVAFATWTDRNPFGLDPKNPNNPNVPAWYADGCIERCISVISLEDAILCAQRQAYLCANTPILTCLQECYNNRHTQDMTQCFERCIPPTNCTDQCFDTINATCLQPDGKLDQNCINANQPAYQACVEKCFPPFAPSYNTYQSCTITCPNGDIRTGVVQPGVYVASTQAEADTIAQEAACIAAYAQGCPGTNPPQPPPTLLCSISTANQLPDATLTQPYAMGLSYSTTAGGTFTWSIVLGALPDGLSLDPNSGVISGTPTVAGPFLFTVQLSNGTTTCHKEFQITASDASCIVDAPTLPDGGTCVPYSHTLTPGPILQPDPGMVLKYSLNSGSLPDGLNLTGGTISGTPTSTGTFTFEICVDQEIGGS